MSKQFRNLIHTVLLLLTTVILAACVSTSSSHNIERIVVFGDSNVDTGNLARLVGGDEPLPNSWRGRNSNGPVVPDYLAQDLDADLRNFAVGGATSGDINVVAGMFPGLAHIEFTGVRRQIGEFVDTEQRFRPSDLVLIWVGSNDILQMPREDSKALAKRIKQTANNINEALDRVRDLGAQRVLVATRTVRAQLGSDDDLNGRDLNVALRETLANYPSSAGFNAEIFDAYASIADMVTHPLRYGFAADVSALCVDSDSCRIERYEDGLSVAQRYINWDYPHKTTRVHRLMASQLLGMLR